MKYVERFLCSANQNDTNTKDLESQIDEEFFQKWLLVFLVGEIVGQCVLNELRIDFFDQNHNVRHEAFA